MKEQFRVILKALLLVLLLQLEFVLGVPFLYVYFSISIMGQVKTMSWVWLSLLFSFFLAVTYDQSLALFFLLYSLSGTVFVYGSTFIPSRVIRYAISLVVVLLPLWYSYRLVWSAQVLAPLVIEILILVIARSWMQRKFYAY